MVPSSPGPYFCLQLRRALSNYRVNFSTSIPAQTNRVPPESPSYTRLPTPPQSDETKPPRVRGHLPVPREIFPYGEGDRKIQPEYVNKTAPRSTKPSSESPSEVQEWKTALAESRRTNLKEGLDTLWLRRREMDRSRNERVSRRFHKHNKAGAAPERYDDKLTRPTVLTAIMDTKVYPDPNRFSCADRSRTKVIAKEKQKLEGRRDALMELYTSASNFIVHENELKAKIDEVFAEDYFRKRSEDGHRHSTTGNVWGSYGKPPSIANMMDSAIGMSTRIMEADQTESDRSAKRQKRIAEDLTGGKMI
ncbi:uncharacterized protein MAM_04705 [Metarhizium album ARSEF 1941]|uniref:Uncharacterized protein n=1 Tax=Metarhizium album (strain ARSEF 1941) TaxID=1081103 RepID=A0A0B2WXV7_METAS|nr:uncharacterized protein MAM_04705 [Metarhizium album ARSEF 1941]KHN97690.1 hypothetical protein MAM_04705 [Metarhizium album ARSEF 1941]